MMTGAGQRPPCEIDLVGGRGVVQEDPQAEQLGSHRRPLDPVHLCGEHVDQSAFERLTRQHRSGPRPKTDGFRRRSLQQVDRSVEELPRGDVTHGSCSNPRASRSLSRTKLKSASRAMGLCDASCTPRYADTAQRPIPLSSLGTTSFVREMSSNRTSANSCKSPFVESNSDSMVA